MSHRMSGLVLLIVLLPPLAAGEPVQATEPVEAAPAPSAGEREVDRLLGLCEAWTAAKLLHPWMFSGAVEPAEWDRAFVEAVPAVRSAGGAGEYREAVAGMLGSLNDPATKVTGDGGEGGEEDESAAGTAREEGAEVGADAAEEEGEEPAGAPAEPPPLFRPVTGDVVLMDLPGYQAAAGPNALLRTLWFQDPRRELNGASGLIVDLRIPPGTPRDQDYTSYALAQAAPRLVPEEVRGPVFRWPVHWGYQPQSGTTSGGYHSGFVSSHAQAIVPAEVTEETGAPPERIVFLTNERSALPEMALALRGAGRARIVGEAPLDPGRLVDTMSIDLGEGLTAEIRATELVPSPRAPFGVDRLVGPADGEGDPALDAALALLAQPFEPLGPDAAEVVPLPPGVWRPDETYPEMRAPDLPHRVLAACRLWGTIEHFYPYTHLIGDWTGSFREALPEFLAEPPPGDDGESYARAVLHLASEIEDGHTQVRGGAVSEVLGRAGAVVGVREIEGRWVVTDVRDAALEGELSPGDVVLAADGVPMEERMRRTLPLVTASNQAERRRRAVTWSLFGEPESTVTLTVSGADGGEREVPVRRGPPLEPPPKDESPPYRLLDGEENLGYVDLMRLETPQVPELFEELGETDGMIFDLRGYPRGTAWAIAPRINDQGAEIGARFRRREVSRFGLYWSDSGYFFAQPLPRGGGEPPYQGEIVVLIDGRAISQSEHSALFFEAAADVAFVGSPTAGANGDVTSLTLPGGLSVYFTGHDVRWPDGRQLQRVGVLPDVEAAPTIEGLRRGEDEVLAVGLRVLRERIAD